ncbi:MAG: 3-isopropylmalate dehydrogenase, partial [Clostridia bacterium]|nr:3-isopropylmalate dehydrogenase [Clostridia bacterium]
MKKTVAVIRGDGIGPEIVEQALKVLRRIESLHGHSFDFVETKMGGAAIDLFGEPLPETELNKC